MSTSLTPAILSEHAVSAAGAEQAVSATHNKTHCSCCGIRRQSRYRCTAKVSSDLDIEVDFGETDVAVSIHNVQRDANVRYMLLPHQFLHRLLVSSSSCAIPLIL